MPDHAADRNLLFGILALQLDFITRDELIAAMVAWTLEKHRTLGEILVERRALAPRFLVLLEPMVDAHVENHHGDPAASLAALGSIETVASALRGSIADPDVLGSLASIPPSRAEDPYETRAGSPPGPAPSVSRYTKVRDHARGGLGIVFVARDEELNREVALKEIQDRHADDPGSRARFLVEAEVTGGLEHPGIVPVYGLGSYDDGRPFYAMRFIRGESLKEAIADFHSDQALKTNPGRKQLALRKLLRRFLDVCNAIEYAHSKGILHRDLKPANVMLGPYGETLVVDWGLAKVLGRVDERTTDGRPLVVSSASGSLQTLPGEVIGTPAYMSPEQADGDLGRLGPVSDVYGLGATLHHMLHGRSPGPSHANHHIEHAEAGRRPPESPYRVGGQSALESICSKAMNRKPGSRYPTARALAEDVERWLADEPISSHEDSPIAVLGRWLRHHRTATAACVALLLAVSASAVVGATLINIEKGRVEAANGLLTTANQKILLEKKQAEEAQKVAQSARDRADASYRLAIAALGDDGVNEGGLLHTIVSSDLPRVPGTERMRLRIAVRTNALLSQLIKQKPDDPGVRFALAKAYRELANLLRLTGRKEAPDAYVAASKLLDGLTGQFPADERYLMHLAETSMDAGEGYRMAGQFDRAGRNSRKALEVAERLIAAHPDDPNCRRTLARALYNGAGFHHDTGNYDEAIRSDERAIALLTPFADGPAPDPMNQMELAMTLGDLGASIRAKGRPLEAEPRLIEAIRRAEEYLARSREDRDLRYIRAYARLELGRVAGTATARRAEALSHLDEAIRGFAELAAGSPEIVHYRQQWAEALLERSRIRSSEGHLDEAQVDANSALEIVEEILRKNPGHPVHSGLLGRITGQLGRLAADRDRPEEAKPLLDRAIASQQVALKANPTSPPDLRALEEHQKARERLPASQPRR